MVILNSDSTTTLVSLDQYDTSNGLKYGNSWIADASCCDKQQNLCRTELLVEECEATWLEERSTTLDGEGASNLASSMMPLSSKVQPLYLPEDGRCLDEYLEGYESLRTSSEDLLVMEPRYFTNTTRKNNIMERLVYVAQGERANATSRECDVLVSDKATTCHILALRSSISCSSSNLNDRRGTLPLSSLTHIDGPLYDQCIRTMIQEHVDYHSQGRSCSSTLAKSSSSTITIEIHVMGGFSDQESNSSAITDWLVGLLAQIAGEFKQQETRPPAGGAACATTPPVVVMLLKTCAVTAMNDTGYSCPIGRGLGIDLHTGRVFLARCHPSVMGPVPILRSVRLWSINQQEHTKTLSVIHSVTGDTCPMSKPGQIIVHPFTFAPFRDIPVLLSLPNEILLQYTSTSPDVEEDGFCDAVRASMRFLLNRQNACHKIFGRHVDRPLVFSRVSGNIWRRVPC
jgi:hypothetical protein